MSLEVDIRKSFGSFELDVSLKAGKETLGLLGESGCGKSLTMRCIAGIEKPDSGRIVVNDKVFFDSANHINLSPQQRKSALLFQNYMLFPNLTVEQNVAAGIDKRKTKEERAQIIAQELHRFSLAGFEKRYPSQLSGGQQQRVALARMLAASPSILMLDEPFSALDSHLKDVLEQNLVGLFDAYDGTILYVSHDIDEAIRFCDKIAVIDNGKVSQVSSPRELIDHPESEAALKLSGVKNLQPAEKRGAHEVYVPRLNISLFVSSEVPDDVKFIGFRAFYIQRAEGPGENNFKVRVDRASDSRFDRSIMLGLVDFENERSQESAAVEDEMKFLHQHLIWRMDKLGKSESDLPAIGDELWIHIPKDRIYAVSR